jgi:hypothetical protein
LLGLLKTSIHAEEESELQLKEAQLVATGLAIAVVVMGKEVQGKMEQITIIIMSGRQFMHNQSQWMNPW